eukprot:CAMPEP_0170380198 /NCGR_PEP_ID=MMETSP0117_2-20130122/13747_1 /TAXON_ID=400756 /ORGANISM="Durinskia baltica, Strain CSIRO CS-38" /LENGTH=214 /DNA_ID=CAMNT_0010635685 /DNA_START=19 /DNA_END=662 /DNA_ORIENTATION=-
MAMKVHGKCGSVRVRLIPAPRGSGVVGSPTLKKMMNFAGVADVFSCSCGHTRTKGNFMKATFEALRATYGYLTPDLWKPTHFVKPPFQEFTDYLAQSKPRPAYDVPGPPLCHPLPLERLAVGVMNFAGVADVFSCSCGHTRTKGNFMKATFEALRATYGYLTPDLWKPTHFVKPPFQEFTDYLANPSRAGRIDPSGSGPPGAQSLGSATPASRK